MITLFDLHVFPRAVRENPNSNYKQYKKKYNLLQGYFVEKLTGKFNTLHRTVSLIDTVFFIGLACLITYNRKPLFIAVVLPLLALEYPIVWGIRTELTKDEQSHLVCSRGFLSFFLPYKLKTKIRLAFLEIITFPFFYVMKSWSK